MGVGIGSVVIPLNRMRVVLVLRKESTHRVISSAPVFVHVVN